MLLRRTTLYLCLVLLACLLGVGATQPLAAAEPIGLLAVLQPATENTLAALKFYSPDAQPVHTVVLTNTATLSTENLSPDGLHWSYVTGGVSGPDDAAAGKALQDDLTLHIRRTSDGAEVATIPLLPPGFPDNIQANAALLLERDPTLNEVGDLEEALSQAFKYSLGAFAWSPDGKQLAFSAAIDGPSSDLYLYDTQDESVTRLSDGIEQIQGIRWSPDGKWIWHTTISYGYCMVCDGHNFAAAADGSRIVTLPGNDVFLFLTWVDGDSYLVTDQANGPGSFDLQLVDVPTGRSRTLWPGVYHSFIYDPTMNRLAVTGTRGQRYDPDEQVFVVDLVTGEDEEFDDLESALVSEPWLAPLAERPVSHPCARPGPIVYPCVELPFDPLSPDGTYLVGDDYVVEEAAGGEQLLPPLPDLAARHILWRPDSAGFFFPQPEQVLYRDLASGDVMTIENATLLGWLPHALAADYAGANPPVPAPVTNPTPVATAEINSPMRRTTLEGSPVEVASDLRLAQSRELAEIAQEMLTPGEYWIERQSGLPLLLAREAVATTFEAYPPLIPEPFVEPETAAALDAVLAASPPRVAAYPSLDHIPSIESLTLSPDGSLIATGHSDGSIRLWDYERGTLMRVMPSATTPIDHLLFSPDGAFIAAGDQTGKVEIWEVASGARMMTHSGRYVDTYAIAWRPHSNDLAIANGLDPIVIHPRNEAAYPLLDAQADALAYSPDGTQLAVALRPPEPPLTDGIWHQPYREPEQRPIWIVDAGSGELLHELADDRATAFMAYTPDGDTLLVGTSYLLRAWEIATGNVRYEITLPDFNYGWAISPDGTQLVITTYTNGISTYDLASGEHLGDQPVRATFTYPLAIHPQDGYLISGYNSIPLLMDPADGTPIVRFGRTRTDFIATSPATSLFATADMHIITVQDLVSERVVYELADAINFVADLAISADGKWLAARERSGHLLLWELDSGRLQWRVAVREEYGGLVAFAPGGQLVTGGSEGVLMVIDPRDGSTMGELTVESAIVSLEVSSRNEAAMIVGISFPVALRVNLDDVLEGTGEDVTMQRMAEPPVANGEIAYSPDGSLLAVARGTTLESQASLELWETTTSKLVRTIALEEQYSVESLAFSPDGQTVVTGASYIAPVTLWDVASGQKVQSLGGAASTLTSIALAYTPDGTQLLATALGGITTRYALTPTHSLRTLTGHRGSVWEVDIHPNGHMAITAGDDQSVRVWDWQTGAQLYEIPDQPEGVSAVDISPDGTTVLVGGEEGQPRLYYSSGALIRTFPAHADMIVDAIFRPDGDAFATSALDGSLRAWSLARAEVTWELEGLAWGGGALAYSPDSTLLAGAAGAGPESVIYLWDAYSGEEVMKLHGHGNHIVALAFSPDGALLASASWDHTIKLWQVATGELVATLEGHSDILTGLAFSPDGSLLASVAEDYTLRLWEVSTATAVTTIQMPRALPWSVRFSNDGHALLTTHADGTLRSWLADANDNSMEAKLLVAAARVPRATAEFTAQERRKYAIDSYAGGYLSASGNINLRPEPYVTSLVSQPVTSPQTDNVVGGTLVALTNEYFLLTSTNQGESWQIVTRLPLTFFHATLGIPARPDDPLLLATDKGLYRVGEDGALTLLNSDPFSAVSYSQSDPDELWALSDYRGDILGNQIYHSMDGGATWSEPYDRFSYQMFSPLLLTSPEDFPQLLTASVQESPIRVVWRVPALDSDEWDTLPELSLLPNSLTPEQGMAWDAQGHTLYLGDATGNLLMSDNVDATAEDVTAAAIAYFGPGTRPVPLAVAPGPVLYVNLLTPGHPMLLRGTWDGIRWYWVELGLPLVGAG